MAYPIPRVFTLATNRDDKNLLMIRRSKGLHAGYWTVPGRNLQNSDKPPTAAESVVRQQTGRTISNLQFVDFYTQESGFLDLFYVGNISGTIGSEYTVKEIKWINIGLVKPNLNELEKMLIGDDEQNRVAKSIRKVLFDQKYARKDVVKKMILMRGNGQETLPI